MTLKLTDFQNLGQSSIQVSPIAYGMWRFAGTDVKTATEKIETALDVGITDQADIYGCDGGGSFGDSEKLFGDVLRANPRSEKNGHRNKRRDCTWRSLRFIRYLPTRSC